MPIYKDLNGDSNIESYEIFKDAIVVKFKGSSRTYKYSYYSAGQTHVEIMKQLAVLGDGLNSYIMRNCKYDYEK